MSSKDQCELDHIDSYERRSSNNPGGNIGSVNGANDGNGHGPHSTSLHNMENTVGRPSVIESSQPHIIECT